MYFALPLIAAFMVGCSGEPVEPVEPWLFCAKTAAALECITKMDGELRRVSIPTDADDDGDIFQPAEPQEGA